jgi:hypothetical protein
MSFFVSYWRSSTTHPGQSYRLTVEVLRRATTLPVALVGRDSHGYYGFSGTVPALVIGRASVAGDGTSSGVARVASFVLAGGPL